MEKETDIVANESSDKPIKSDFKSILAGINELNKQQIQKVYIPSIGEEINFKPLTIKQQKHILSSGVDTNIENMSFSNTMNDIILENCLASKSKIKSIDKPLILLQLRQKAVDDIVKITNDDVEYTFSIQEKVDEIKKKFKEKIETSFEIQVSGVTIKGSAPNLTTDTKYNKQFTKSVKKNSTGRLALTDVVGDIYIHEIVKYVDVVSLGGNTIDMSDGVSISQSVEIFESLPMSISNVIANKIKNIREVENLSTTNETFPDDVQVGIDASLFTGE